MRADLAFLNGHVVTVDPARPHAEAVAVQGGRIVAVGSTPEVRAWIGPGTEVVDLSGRSLVPGFQDAHAHPCLAGIEMRQCDVSGLPEDPAAYAAAVADYASAHPELPWILGSGWAISAFPGGIASRHVLDAVVPDRPVMLVNRDGHGAWVNTAALDLAGIDAAAPDPGDGRIERDAVGEPVGTLQEGAIKLVDRYAPDPHQSEIADGILEAQRYLLSLGITAWQDAWVTPRQHAAYTDLAGDGRLLARVVGCLWWQRDRGADQIPELVEQRADATAGRYRATSVKIMQDGVCENFTAAMLTPYLDERGRPSDRVGISFVEPDEVARQVTALDRLGFQVHFHAIGDRAVRECLDAVAVARATNGPSDNRHHVAHLQVIDPSDRPRFAELGVTANMQPLWAHHDAYQDELTIPFLGPERSARQYPWRSLAAAGARLAMGSDWNVSTPNPFELIHVAVHRHHPDGRNGVFYPDQRLTLDQALTAATMGSAYVNHLDGSTGSITPGKLADLAVVDRTLAGFGRRALDGDPTFIDATIDLTFIEGDLVHER
jgi:predicted amidohydrolase YtcJ